VGLRRAVLLALFVLAPAFGSPPLTVANCTGDAGTHAGPILDDCAQLETLAGRFGRRVRQELPDVRALDRIIADLGHDEHSPSLLELFAAWARAQLAAIADAFPDFNIELPELGLEWPGALTALLKWTGILLLSALILAALAVLWRTHGRRWGAVFQRVRGSWRAGTVREPVFAEPSLDQLAGAPAAQQPRILLAVLISALRSAHRLGPDAALSHRQLGQAVRGATAGELAAIARVARLAERVTYSDSRPADGELADAIGATREIIAGVAQ